MGLDITAYRKLTPAPDAAREDGCVVDWRTHFGCYQSTLNWTEENWPGHSGGIKPGAYAFTEKHSFRAGSYSGYSAWRDWLARVAGWHSIGECWKSPDQKSKPFAELLNFADNEGVIGPKVATELAKDFADNQTRAEGLGGKWELELYAHWRKAFDMAADSGVVDFH